MNTIRTAAPFAAAAALALATFSISLAQQGQPSKGSQPSNPIPAPSNPLPSSTSPRPADSAPDTKDASRNFAPGTQRWSRPFAFQNPQDESRFSQNAQRLSRLEERLATSNQTLIRRLGEIRQMSPDKQNPATMDLLQQMLQNQAELQQYLVQSRIAWSGDLTPQTQEAPTAPFGSLPTGAGQPGTAVSPDRP
jgi:hypothetical protein